MTGQFINPHAVEYDFVPIVQDVRLFKNWIKSHRSSNRIGTMLDDLDTPIGNYLKTLEEYKGWGFCVNSACISGGPETEGLWHPTLYVNRAAWPRWIESFYRAFHTWASPVIAGDVARKIDLGSVELPTIHRPARTIIPAAGLPPKQEQVRQSTQLALPAPSEVPFDVTKLPNKKPEGGEVQPNPTPTPEQPFWHGAAVAHKDPW